MLFVGLKHLTKKMKGGIIDLCKRWVLSLPKSADVAEDTSINEPDKRSIQTVMD